MAKKWWAIVAGAGTILALVFFGWKLDDRYLLAKEGTAIADSSIAKIAEVAGDVKLVEYRLEQKIVGDDLRYTRQQIYDIRKNYMDADGRWLPDVDEYIKELYYQFLLDEEELKLRKEGG
jgi:hypothetical protein